MQLTSPVFNTNEKIPAKYTCDGENISPPLEISGVPEGAKSLVLIMDDPDIPEAAKKIEEGMNPPGVLGKNTRDNMAYGSPCPPDKEHRYFFKLYALDIVLELPAGSSKAGVEKAMLGHALEKVELVGRYERG